MNLRRALLCATTCLAITAGWLSPAQAAEVTFTADSTTTPGHVVFSITGLPQAYARVETVSPGVGFYAHSGDVAVVDGAATIDMGTWGMASNSFARLYMCEVPNWCSTLVATVEFQPTDPVPDVTWPDVSSVGASGPDYTISVSDPGGGGHLVAFYAGEAQSVPRFGDATLTFPGATNHDMPIEIYRCFQSVTGSVFCAPTGAESAPVAVRRSLTVEATIVPTTTTVSAGGRVRPDGDALTPDLTVRLSSTDPGEYDLEWTILKDGAPTAFSGTGSVALQQTEFAEAGVEFDIDITGLGTGHYTVRTSLSHTYSEVGLLEGQASPVLDVDVTAPTASVSANLSIQYPYHDIYKDDVTFTVNRSESDAQVKLEVLSQAGAVVRMWLNAKPIFKWDGRTVTGAMVPEGLYSVRATARDALGNSKVSAGTPLVISHKRLVTKTFKKTIPATRTLANQYVGKCSTLAKNVRGWSGSIGLYTNTKCDGNFRASVVVAVHALRMPRAERYGRFQITTYGGAAKTRPGSYLFFDMRKNNGDWGTNDTRLGYTVGGHAGPERAGSDYVWADRYVVWSVYTALGARYDVKTFTIRMKYDVLM